jgi:hypothetical protein
VQRIKRVEKRTKVYIDPVTVVSSPIVETGRGMLYMIKVRTLQHNL